MGSKTRVHEDRKDKHLKKIHQDEIDNRDEIQYNSQHKKEIIYEYKLGRRYEPNA